MQLCCSCCADAHSHTKCLGKYHVMLMNFQRDDAWRMLIEMKQITQNIKHVDILCSHMFLDRVLYCLQLFVIYIYIFFFSRHFDPDLKRCDIGIYHKIALFICHGVPIQV